MAPSPPRSAWLLPLVLALPALSLAGAGLFHPHGLSYETSTRWWTLHLPGLLAFPLVGVALIVLVRGRLDPMAWLVRLAAYGYATFYSALDVINGIAAGYVTHQLGPGVPRPDEIRFLFRIGSPLGEIGSWSLLLACAALAVDQLLRRQTAALGGLLLLPGAWLVHIDHIFSPTGALGMVLIAAGTAALAWAQRRGPRTGPGQVSPITHGSPVTNR